MVARNLYRAYLYSVCIGLLIFATITVVNPLRLLLSSTLLRYPEASLPDDREVTQALVLLVTAWLVTLLLGGLHYWLIRRDMASDPSAGGGAVRSFALNITQMIAALVAALSAAVGIAALGQPYNSFTNTTITGFSFAIAIATTGLFALLQWERSRTRVATRGALALQRLHLYGAQLILVVIAWPFWTQAVQTAVIDGFINAGQYNPCSGDPSCSPGANFPVAQVLAQIAAALFIAVCWTGYTAFSRTDRHSRLRQVTHLLAIGFGLGFLIRGVQGYLEATLRSVSGNPFQSFEFAYGAAQATGAVVFGAVVLLAYLWLHRREAADLPSGQPAAGLALLAVFGVVFAFPFWSGLITLLMDLLERGVPGGANPTAAELARAVAIVLSGLPFLYISVRLSQRAQRTGVTWPNRVFVLVLLAGGVLFSAAGLVMTLQAFGSTLLGAPPDEWQHSVRTGLVTLLIGGVMVAIFATMAVRSRYLGTREEPKPVVAPLPSSDTQSVAAPSVASTVSGSPESIEAILDALLAGNLTRDEAAARLREQQRSL